LLRTASVLETPQDGYCVAVSIEQYNEYVAELRSNLIDYYSGVLNNVVTFFKQKIKKDKLHHNLLMKESESLNQKYLQIIKDC